MEQAEPHGRWPIGSGRSGSPTWSARITCSAPRRTHPHARRRLARLDDLLGAARHRQDDGGAACWRRRPTSNSSDLRRFLGRRRPQEGLRCGARPPRAGEGDLLFVDEIHRFNRAQQDSFLPVMEDGTVTLVGATTENPSFELNAALAVARPRAGLPPPRRRGDRPAPRPRRGGEGTGLSPSTTPPALLIGMADRDGRAALTLAEEVWRAARGRVKSFGARSAPGDSAAPGPDLRQGPGRPLQPDLRPPQVGARLRSRRGPLLPRSHARCRGAAALIGRRLVRMAMEDIGLADPAGAGGRARRQGHLRLSRFAGGRTGAGARPPSTCDRAEVERGLYRLQGGHPGGEGGRLAGAAQASSSMPPPA